MTVKVRSIRRKGIVMKRTIVIAILCGLVGLVLGFIAANVIFQISVDEFITELWRTM